MPSFYEFIDSFYLWRDALMVAAVTGGICGFLGVYVVLRKIIFVSIALTQVSSFGVVLAFYIQAVTAGSFFLFADSFVFSVLVTLTAALFFALKKSYFPLNREAIIAFGFIITSALLLIVGGWIEQGLHEVHGVLFGNAVVASPLDALLVPLNAILVLIIHIVLFKDMLFVSYDSETARLFNYPMVFLNIVLYFTIAVVIALSTRAMGALPVFALLTLPAMFSFQLSESIKTIFIMSSVLGIITAVVGYYISFVWSLPTGASIAFCCAVLFLASFVIKGICHSKIIGRIRQVFKRKQSAV